MTEAFLLHVLIDLYETFNMRKVRRRLFYHYGSNFLSLFSKVLAENELVMKPSNQMCIYKVLPDASMISTLILKAWWEFIKALVNRLRRLQLRYNAKIIRGSGNSRLAKCFRGRMPGTVKRNYAKVIYAWCGTDGSLLQPVKAYKRADWSSVRDDLEPMLASVRKFGLEEGLSTFDTLPVGHSTDSYNRDCKRLAELYDSI